MKQNKSSKPKHSAMTPQRSMRIKAWAFFVRYGMLLGIPLPGLVIRTFTEARCARWLGVAGGCVFFSLYYLIGYLLRWTHMYCVYQDAYHQKMTPDRVDWSKIRKTDAYGIPLIFFVIGVMLAVAALFE